MPASQSACTNSTACLSISATAPGLNQAPESPSAPAEPAMPSAAKRASGSMSVNAPNVVPTLDWAWAVAARHRHAQATAAAERSAMPIEAASESERLESLTSPPRTCP